MNTRHCAFTVLISFIWNTTQLCVAYEKDSFSHSDVFYSHLKPSNHPITSAPDQSEDTIIPPPNHRDTYKPITFSRQINADTFINKTTRPRQGRFQSTSQDDFMRRNYDFEDHVGANIYNDAVDRNRVWIASPNSSSKSFVESGLRKWDYGNWPTKLGQTYSGKKRRKSFLDEFDDYVASDSDRHSEASNRKYVHEHEGFFFPIQVPSHHEKEDNLLPILLLLLLPLLLFAIIIPLNANLLSTLFLIMQNNGAATAAAQLGVGRRKKRFLVNAKNHPSLDQSIIEVMTLLDTAIELFGEKEIPFL